MKQKRLVFGLLLLSFMLTACGTSTADSSTTPQKIFQNVVTLGFLKDLGVLQQTIDPIEGFTRFLLLVLLFALLFKAAELLKLGKNVAIVIAAVISLITTIFIPGTVLLAVGTSYGTLFSLLLLAIPIGLGVFGYFELKENPWLRVVLMGLIWFLLSQMWRYLLTWKGAATSAYATVIDAVVSWIGAAVWIVAIIFFLNLIQAIVGFASGHTGDKLDAKSTAQWIHNKAKKGERRRKTAMLNEYIEEEKELKYLDDAMVARERAKDFVDNIVRFGTFNTEADRDTFVELVKTVANYLHDAKTEFRRLTKRTWRQETKFQDLIKEFKDKDKDIKQLEVLEKIVLDKHKEAIDALDTALDSAEDLLQQSRKEASTVTSFPSHLTASDKAALTTISAGLKALDISNAEKAQKEAIQAVQGIVTEARELMKWKD